MEGTQMDGEKVINVGYYGGSQVDIEVVARLLIG